MVCNTKENLICQIYTQVLQGKELEKIKTTKEIKDIIVIFSKCSLNMTAFEIHIAHPEISTGVAFKLRHIRKLENRKKNSTRGLFQTIGIGEVVREISIGVPKADIKKLGVADSLYRRANRFIKMALKNTKPEIIEAKLNLSSYTVKKMLETFNQNYRKYFENKEEKIIIEV